MSIVVTGATGFIGRSLCKMLKEAGQEVIALSRNTERAQILLGPSVRCLVWGSATETEWRQAIREAETVVHLAGEAVAEQRWTEAFKAKLWSSRVETTRDIVSRMKERETPGALVCASAIGYYGDRGEETVTEESKPGSGFLAELCEAWEAEAYQAEPLGIRVARMRIGVVLGRSGPLQKILYPLPVPLSPWKLGIGGPVGSGRQWFSWIHLDDAVGLLFRAATDSQVRGAVNVVSPNPIRNREFAQALGRTLHRPAFLPVPPFALRLLAGGFADELLGGQRVLPATAERLGYSYRFPTIDAALTDLLTPDTTPLPPPR